MKNIITVSIGIPAYNEGANIQNLLTSLLQQNEQGIMIKEIIVVSDGSNDDTAQKVNALQTDKIKCKDDRKRLGKTARLNYIFKTFNSDVLILMDADITIKDKNIIAKAIRHANLQKSGIVGINATPLKAETSFEQIVETGVLIMKNIAKSWNNGNNYLSFKGCFLVLERKLAKKLHMPAEIVNNDAYLYFAAVQAGYAPSYLEDSKVFYRSPMTLQDHVKQSSRYQSSESELRTYFKLDWDKQYKIPLTTVVTSMIKVFFSRPLRMMQYIAILLYTKIHKQSNIKSTWSIASSTKGKIHS